MANRRGEADNRSFANLHGDSGRGSRVAMAQAVVAGLGWAFATPSFAEVCCH